MNATIKMTNQQKGFGFLRTEDGREIFFHRSAVRGCAFELIENGQRVTFELGDDTGKGPRASRVQFGR